MNQDHPNRPSPIGGTAARLRSLVGRLWPGAARRRQVTGALAVVAALLLSIAAASQQALFRTYLPLVYDETPTPVVTVTPTSGTCVALGNSVRFWDSPNGAPLGGVVAACYRVSQFTRSDGTLVRPSLGNFVVILLDVHNYGSHPAQVRMLDSFGLEAGSGYPYGLATLEVQQAAAESFARPTVFSSISAGATARQVFAFDVPDGVTGLRLVAEHSW